MEYQIAYPRPGALIESLRSVGYSTPTAIADIIDNSISAGARNIHVNFYWNAGESVVSILDDGKGMSGEELFEAMRPGSSSPTLERESSDLGRFGLGLKMASFSQSRRLSVWSKTQTSSIDGKCWDLDHVVRHDEWRLLTDIPPPESEEFNQLAGQRSGTLVVWDRLDRLVLEGSPDAGEHHQRFLLLIQEVKQYLEMIFHRFLTRTLYSGLPTVTIRLNGNSLKGWDPFNISPDAISDLTPVDEISFQGSIVRVRGYVLPHKDQLTEDEFYRGGGPKGWNAQQGFYIYRNDRMLVPGDWLRLGPAGKPWAKEEHYRLARLSIDIDNVHDMQWHLDVKKSTASPPPDLRNRLNGLAEMVRQKARSIFVHRGAIGARPPAALETVERPWESGTRSNRIVYKINRSHPLITGVLKKLGPLSADVEAILRLLEETVPVQKIWIDSAESDYDHATPYEGVNQSQIMSDIRKTYSFLRDIPMDHAGAVAYLLASEPFNRYRNLVESLEE